jgi:hypothetical protein
MAPGRGAPDITFVLELRRGDGWEVWEIHGELFLHGNVLLLREDGLFRAQLPLVLALTQRLRSNWKLLSV